MVEEAKSTSEKEAVQATEAKNEALEKPKKKKTWLWVLLGCGGCIVCIAAIVIGVLAIVGRGVVSLYSSFKDQLAEANPLCKVDTTTDLRSVYEEYMTERYQKKVPYSEFKDMWEENKEIFKKCDLFAPSISDLFGGKVLFSTETEDNVTKIRMERRVDSKKVIVDIVIEEEGAVKFDDIRVEK